MEGLQHCHVVIENMRHGECMNNLRNLCIWGGSVHSRNAITLTAVDHDHKWCDMQTATLEPIMKDMHGLRESLLFKLLSSFNTSLWTCPKDLWINALVAQRKSFIVFFFNGTFLLVASIWAISEHLVSPFVKLIIWSQNKIIWFVSNRYTSKAGTNRRANHWLFLLSPLSSLYLTKTYVWYAWI